MGLSRRQFLKMSAGAANVTIADGMLACAVPWTSEMRKTERTPPPPARQVMQEESKQFKIHKYKGPSDRGSKRRKFYPAKKAGHGDGPRFVGKSQEPERSMAYRRQMSTDGSPSTSISAGWRWSAGGELMAQGSGVKCVAPPGAAGIHH